MDWRVVAIIAAAAALFFLWVDGWSCNKIGMCRRQWEQNMDLQRREYYPPAGRSSAVTVPLPGEGEVTDRVTVEVDDGK